MTIPTTPADATEAPSPRIARAAATVERIVANADTVVVGKSDIIRLVLAAFACRGHVLLEDVPGTAKTVLARAIASSIEGASAGRIQCTPDIQPTDVTGLSIWNPETRRFEFQPGPIFVNVLLVDEINRALPKAQSALLEGMAEQQVTVDGVGHPLPDPFLVMATENPIEQEGTFPLPEAQLDRFFLRTSLGYPTVDEEVAIVDSQLHGHPLEQVRPVAQLDDVRDVFGAIEDVYIDPLLKRWAIELVRATRSSELVDVGASVRGSLALERGARARALVFGRAFVSPEDIEALFLPVIVHRLVLVPDVIVEAGFRGMAAVGQRIWEACLEAAPRPEPEWEGGAPPPRPGA